MRPATFLVALLLPAGLGAQSADSVCAAMRRVTLGVWAEYELSGVAGHEAHGHLRNAIVGSETRNDSTFWWHESSVTAEEGTVIIKTLVPGVPFEARQVHDLVMKMNDEPAMRMPDYMLTLMQQQEGPPDQAYLTVGECAAAENLGWEELDTPLGAVRALHTRTADASGETVDVWMTPAVPFGILRLQGGGVELRLVAHGTGATTAITETPREMR